MSLQDDGSVIVVPRRRISGGLDEPYRLLEVGDHIEIFNYGWGVVRGLHKKGTEMSVELLKKRPDPGRQDFPEWRFARRFSGVKLRYWRGNHPHDEPQVFGGPFG